MNAKDIQRLARKIMTGVQAGRQSDPAFYGGLSVLPNPDQILRAMGREAEAFDAIMSDAHVIGEVRTIRAALLGYQIRVVSTAEDGTKEQQAAELCRQWLAQKPAKGMTWGDVIWNMGTAVFYGRRFHELDWQLTDGYLLPNQVLDVPNRRMVFDNENAPKLLTRLSPVEGEPIEEYKYLITRHMPTTENPYGRAVLSSCFWPYTFKHGGFKLFYQFCERFGLPWPVGKYPAGTSPEDQDFLLQALVDMAQAGAATIPNDDSVELHSVNVSGELVQEALVHLCNREMSKALTSQTLATEMRNVGSNAAAKTHSERQLNVNEADRNIIVATMNEAFSLITKFNFGDDVTPPTFQFFKEKETRKERAEIWQIAAEIGEPSKKAFHEEMNIPIAESESDRLASSGKPTTPTSDFSGGCNRCGSSFDFAGSDNPDLTAATVGAVDSVIEGDFLEPVYQMLREYEEDGRTLREFMTDLPTYLVGLDDDALVDVTSQVFRYAVAEGMDGA